VAEGLRDLYLLKFDKTLSFGEKRMLDRAQQLLVKELAIAREMEEKEVEDDLALIFADAVPALPEAVEEPKQDKIVEPEPVVVAAKTSKARASARPKAKTGTLRE